MSLFFATFMTGIAFVAAGAVLLWSGRSVGVIARRFPRSRRAAWTGMTLSTVWFLALVTRLGEADFGAYSNQLFAAFGALAVLTFFYVREFLAVRSFCILYLLLAAVLLDAAFMKEPATRLFLVTPVYAGIVTALYLAVVPYRFRDFLEWLFVREIRARVLGGVFLGYGIWLGVIALNY